MAEEALASIEEKLRAFWPSFGDEAGEDNDPGKFLVNRDWANFSLPTLKVRAAGQGLSAENYRLNLIRSHDTIELLFDSLHLLGPRAADYRRPTSVWARRAFDFLRTSDDTRGFSIVKDDLLQTAASYLSHPEIQTNMLDWQFLDAIVFQELDAYGDHFVTTKAGAG